MSVEVVREPEGMPYIERCVDCQRATRYWAGEGEYPLCPECAEKKDEK